MKKVVVLYPTKVVQKVRIKIEKLSFFKYKVTYEYLNSENEVLRESIEFGNWFTIMSKINKSIDWLMFQYKISRNKVIVFSESKVILNKIYKRFK